jgi:beta-lactamase class C
MRSNLDDMMRYLQANMIAEEHYAMISKTHDVIIDMSKPSLYVGLGWLVAEKGRDKIIRHHGTTPGFNCYIGFNKQLKKGIVVLSNSSHWQDKIAVAYLTNKLNTLIKFQKIN